MEIRVEGVTSTGGYTPTLLPRRITILGEKPLPSARPIDRARFLAGAQSAERIEARGVVLGVDALDAAYWELHIQAEDFPFWVAISRSILRDPTRVLDATVKVRGVCATGYNSRGEFLNAGIFVSTRDDFIVEASGSPSPFAIPLVPLNRLAAFQNEPRSPHRVRVEGTVVYVQSGAFFFLQEGNRSIRVNWRAADELHPGDRVQAVGFVDMSRQVAGLSSAEVRKIGEAPIIPPVDISPEQVVAIQGAPQKGESAEDDYDGQAIRFTATLLAVQTREADGVPSRQLVLKRDGMVIVATLAHGDLRPIDALRPNSELLVSGVVQLEYAPSAATRKARLPSGLSLWLRGPADIVVRHAPSWWTVQRLVGAVVIVVSALALAMRWVWQLRRQVRRKTAELAEQMQARRNAAVEFQATLRERNQLAANLHDTLLQSMNGIGFQLDACEAQIADLTAERKQPGHLEVARDMVAQAVHELRNSVWTLRTLPLGGMGFREALARLSQRLAAERKTTIEVNVEGDLSRVPEFVGGNLILAIQEAMLNAVRHGNPRKIVVEARAEENPDRIEVSIRDDGVGFEPGLEPKMTEGHFGLTGIRERMKRLDGTMTLESAPQRGTVVKLSVPLRPYDPEIA